MKRKVSILLLAVLAAMLLGSMTGAAAAVRISIGNDRDSHAVLKFPEGTLAADSTFKLNGIEFRAEADNDSVNVTYGDLATALILKGIKGELKNAGLSLDDLYIQDGCVGLKSASSESASALTKAMSAAGVSGQWVACGNTLAFRADSNALYLRSADVAKARFTLKAYDAQGSKVGSTTLRIKTIFDHGNIPDIADVRPTAEATWVPN